MRTRPGPVEPEVYFGIVHAAGDGRHGVNVATYREQPVDMALRLKGAFENGKIGALTRRVATARVVSIATTSPGNPKTPREPKTPRVTEFLRKAIEWRALLDSGTIANQADIGRREGITRVRVAQIMALLWLAPEFREYVLAMPDTARRPPVTERMLCTIELITHDPDQVRAFRRLLTS